MQAFILSAQTICSWEAERSSHRPPQMERIVALQGLNKRSVVNILKSADSSGGK